MEQLVLYLVSKGFATCYLGDAKSKPDLDQYQPMIVVAFGKGGVTAVKAGQPQEVNRACESAAGSAAKCPKDYRGSKDCAICIQSPALAFYAAGWKNSYLYEKESLMQTKRMKELTLLDIGIAMCHMALAAEELWLDWRLSREDTSKELIWKGCQYVATLYYEIKAFDFVCS